MNDFHDSTKQTNGNKKQLMKSSWHTRHEPNDWQ